MRTRCQKKRYEKSNQEKYIYLDTFLSFFPKRKKKETPEKDSLQKSILIYSDRMGHTDAPIHYYKDQEFPEVLRD